MMYGGKWERCIVGFVRPHRMGHYSTLILKMAADGENGLLMLQMSHIDLNPNIHDGWLVWE